MQAERLLQAARTTTRRWTIRRKAALLEAVRSGMLSLEKASQRYALSLEELRTWERNFDRYGVYGLRATRVQIYRAVGSSSGPKKATIVKGAVKTRGMKQLEEKNTNLKRLVDDLFSNRTTQRKGRRRTS
jgi:Protein of unknown function (DUF1153)